MTDASSAESFPVFPIFLLIDVSGSMGQSGALAAVNDALPGFRTAIKDDPAAGEVARIGVITFHAEARSVLPLCDLQYVDTLPKLVAGGETDFVEAFRVARRDIEAQIRALGKDAEWYTPVVFFISDGRHDENRRGFGDWSEAHRLLTDNAWKYRPRIVTFGFGEAQADEIARIATEWVDSKNGERRHHAYLAKSRDVVAVVKDIIATLIGSIHTTSGDLQAGVSGLTVDADPNKFTALPVAPLTLQRN